MKIKDVCTYAPKSNIKAVDYPPTSEILADIDGLYKELGEVLNELGGLLNG